MLQTLYIVRHCKAEGQAPASELTSAGRAQAQLLADVLSGYPIERIISSTFLRAVQSIEPLAVRLELSIELEPDLCERVLSAGELPDWQSRLQASFDDFDLSFSGGESSRAAQLRARAVVDSIMRGKSRTIVIVSHGNVITLLLNTFDQRYGYDDWQNLSNPDLFCVSNLHNKPEVKRLWKS